MPPTRTPLTACLMRITDTDIALAMALADAAGAAIRPHFRAPFDVEIKEDASPVTIADRAAEQAMRALLAAEAPRDGISGEEFGTTEGSTGRQWRKRVLIALSRSRERVG